MAIYIRTKGRIVYNAYFSTRTRVVALKHCVKVDRILGKVLNATKVSVVFFYLLNQGL